ncbi:MAG: GGDEF domain-containing protein, partial [Ectothiorhodospiraceae bacterium]|nr:GGDEF domain-containing protein [Ectothiorhodospiraceae bacterium]
IGTVSSEVPAAGSLPGKRFPRFGRMLYKDVPALATSAERTAPVKQINDRLGHAVGDDILCRFVAVVERMLRVEDVLCRFGGEEFVALLPGTSAAQALAAGERLRIAYVDESAATQTAKQLPFAISVSIGIGELREDEDIDGLIRRADAALYEAKVRGRNRCELAGDTLGEIVDGAATV